MTLSWRPFSARIQGKPWDETLYEDVPAHLDSPLREWLKGTIPSGQTATRIMVQLRIPRRSFIDAPWKDLIAQPTELLIDIVDCTLKIIPRSLPWGIKVEELDELLLDSGSAYRVAQSRDGLERRVDPTVTSGFNQSVDKASANVNSGSAADHLQKAWKAVYGLHPDPSQAYSEAIKAVEAAAQSTVQPNHPKATLGTMIPEMRQAVHKFTCVIAVQGGVTKSGAEPFADLMDKIWKGQTSRHAGQVATRTETQEEAEAAVHVAILLVYMFTSGAIVRQP